MKIAIGVFSPYCYIYDVAFLPAFSLTRKSSIRTSRIPPELANLFIRSRQKEKSLPSQSNLDNLPAHFDLPVYLGLGNGAF